MAQMPRARTAELAELERRERLRLVLRGDSVVEWRRLYFRDIGQVNRFLRLCEIDPQDTDDGRWMWTVLSDAVNFLEQNFDFRVPDAVARPARVQDLFLYASGAKGSVGLRRAACVVLKVMHVIQHVESRDLLFNTVVSEAVLAEMVTEKVTAACQRMAEEGLHVVEFKGSVKTRDSLITKLLAKRANVAAQIYDKTRFRIVTRSRRDVVRAVDFLTEQIFPFNYVVPGQTENSLIPWETVVGSGNRRLPRGRKREKDEVTLSNGNAFSGAGYNVLNFVADVPVRFDRFLPDPAYDYRPRRCRVAFALAEFQVVDAETAAINEHGDNAHALYKRRQKDMVLQRLFQSARGDTSLQD